MAALGRHVFSVLNADDVCVLYFCRTLWSTMTVYCVYVYAQTKERKFLSSMHGWK